MLGGLGWPELLIILFIVVLIFGVGKLPQMGESLGEAIRGFRSAMSGSDSEEDETEEKK